MMGDKTLPVPIIAAAPWEKPKSPTSLSYWFPIIEAAGLPVPKTQILPMPESAKDDVWEIFDNKKSNGALEQFGEELRSAAADFGSPFFLRTDLTSGKHEWDRACFVADPAKIVEHILTIACYSEMGWLPWDGDWVVREMLPTIPIATCPRFDNMPVCREFRFFVNGPEVECFHPYWPLHALQQGACPNAEDVYQDLLALEDEEALRVLASQAGAALGGRWSVDLLETEHGWHLTDMAEAHKSFHFDGCENVQGE